MILDPKLLKLISDEELVAAATLIGIKNANRTKKESLVPFFIKAVEALPEVDQETLDEKVVNMYNHIIQTFELDKEEEPEVVEAPPSEEPTEPEPEKSKKKEVKKSMAKEKEKKGKKAVSKVTSKPKAEKRGDNKSEIIRKMFEAKKTDDQIIAHITKLFVAEGKDAAWGTKRAKAKMRFLRKKS